MGDLSYRAEEKIESPEDVRERQKEERRKQIEYDQQQGMRREIGLPKTKIDSVIHIIKSDAEREEEKEEQDRHDYGTGMKFSPRRAGWS